MKKGNVSSEVIFWLWRFIPTVFIILFLGFVMFMYLDQEVKITELETNLLTKDLIYSCLIFNDGIRAHRGVIDLDKFTTEKLSKCALRENLGYKVTINSKSVYVMSAEFRKWIDVCNTIKGFECEKQEELVLIGEDLVPAKLTVEVIKNEQ